MKAGDAERLLGQRARALDRTPVVFAAGNRRWRVTPEQLGVRADWHGAVELAQRQGDGFGPLRGFRRLDVRVFGAEVAPPTRVYEAALDYEVEFLLRNGAEAIGVYRRCEKMLAATLGVAPGDKTLALYRTLQLGEGRV